MHLNILTMKHAPEYCLASQVISKTEAHICELR